VRRRTAGQGPSCTCGHLNPKLGQDPALSRAVTGNAGWGRGPALAPRLGVTSPPPSPQASLGGAHAVAVSALPSSFNSVPTSESQSPGQARFSNIPGPFTARPGLRSRPVTARAGSGPARAQAAVSARSPPALSRDQSKCELTFRGSKCERNHVGQHTDCRDRLVVRPPVALMHLSYISRE
jgi:hypothetical protein